MIAGIINRGTEQVIFARELDSSLEKTKRSHTNVL
jgi:hypothetical protein